MNTLLLKQPASVADSAPKAVFLSDETRDAYDRAAGCT